MDRRAFVGTLVGGVLAASRVTEAQQAGKVWRIGVLVPVEPDDPNEPNVGAFRRALQNLGYDDGQNIALVKRYAYGREELYSQLALELVRLGVDILVTGSWQTTLAAKKATQATPIVGVGMGSDPVRLGIVPSLNRPGGNVTGSTWAIGAEFSGKWVDLLKQAAPRIVRVAYLIDPRMALANQLTLDGTRAAAKALGLAHQVLQVDDLRQVEKLLGQLGKERDTALIIQPSLFFMAHAADITALVAKYRLPAIYSLRSFMDAGGLMSYGPSLPDLWRGAATYVDRIVKGAKPGDLPIEQPTKFELVINLKTAKALGLTIPRSLLLQADEVIE